MVGQTLSMLDAVAKYENSVLNKSDNEINVAKIKLFEKKKMPYKLTVNEVHSFDKKIVKRGKKMIINNKYILFNSWYTKNRKNHWLSSHDMWNYMKTHHNSCKSFIDLFDYMEKLGKSIKWQKRCDAFLETSGSDEPVDHHQKLTVRKKKHDVDLEEIKESNDRRLKMYEEFYRVLTLTYETSSPPVSSCIYDSKLTKTAVENGVQAFKNAVGKLEESKRENGVATPCVNANAIVTTATEQQQQQQRQYYNQQQSTGGNVVVNGVDNVVEQKATYAGKKRKHASMSGSSGSSNQPSLPSKKHFGIKQKNNEDYNMVDDYIEDSMMSV
ncbi:39K [Trabala vishnou gigantina nucleopolyhedrovirus]|uniref:39K n=1 Tax=Trabala vishnou gigantina nucleopolyhedrovirus TaxID=2863583 RepID=UPI002481BC53|nr:39K [Trabala vishnou gigantina nucleopolyhedrovirus]QYC92702.1 39K [Trabala vishnou gigantina nucleopolyhedrovirus]